MGLYVRLASPFCLSDGSDVDVSLLVTEMFSGIQDSENKKLRFVLPLGSQTAILSF